MQLPAGLRRQGRSAFIGCSLLFGADLARGTDSYDPASRQLTSPALQIGSASYSNVVMTVGHIVSGPAGSSPGASLDTYDPATHQLTVPAVTVGPTTYFNVVATVDGLVSIGGVSGADNYDGAQLHMALVQAAGAVYANVDVTETLGNVVRVAGGMPTAAPDTYSNATDNTLSIPAVQVGNHVYTNVVVTAGTLKSVGPVAFRNQATVLQGFSPSYGDGTAPGTRLIQGTDGNFYGTTSQGGSNPGLTGTVFRITPGGAFTVLHSLGGPGDGAFPLGSLIQASDGNFYGTTFTGGSVQHGSIFKITPTGVETVLYSSSGNDPDYLETPLIQGRDGNFYGTSDGSGNGQGTVFKLTNFVPVP